MYRVRSLCVSHGRFISAKTHSELVSGTLTALIVTGWDIVGVVETRYGRWWNSWRGTVIYFAADTDDVGVAAMRPAAVDLLDETLKDVDPNP